LRAHRQQYQIWHAEIKPVQERLVAALFSFTDGTSGSRAAAEIQTLFVNPRNHQPGILAHAYLAYKNRFSQLFLATKETVSSIPVPQVVVIDDVRVSEEDRVMTLESARGSADRVLLLSPRRVTYEGVTVAQTFASVQDWLQQDRQVLFIGVGATVPTLQESQFPTVQNAVHCFSGTTANSPFMPIKRKILGLQKRGGVSLKLTGCTVDAPNHFCTDIQAVLLSGKFFCDYYPINQPIDFGQFPLSIYHHLAPVATFVLYPFLLDRTRTDDVYLEQQMSRYGRLVSTAGY